MPDRPGTLRETSYTPKLAGLDDIGSSLITLSVSVDRYRENIRAIRDFVAPSKLILVVKANAYGFGIVGLVPILEEFHDDVSLAVANADEALELRALGYNGRVILLGYTHPKNYYQIIHSGCQLAAYRPENIPALAEACRKLDRPLEVHVKVDTGMVRLGVPISELAAFLAELKRFPQIAVVGLFSHLVDGGNVDAEINFRQLASFEKAIKLATKTLGYHPECHLANSGAVLNHPGMHLDSVRVGILAYGVFPPGNSAGENQVGVQPCYKLASEVIDLHTLKPGEGVSYCHSYVAQRETNIATMPLGYADGLFRKLGNTASVLIKGKRYPLVGSITMDYVMADLGRDTVSIGEEVVFLGTQGPETISVEDVASLAGTIPYELTCALGRRVRREYVEE